jgi:hypothetical protein
MFMNPKDAPFAVAMAVFLLGLVRAFEQYPRPSAATLAILGLGFGLAIGSRIMAGFGVLYALAGTALIVTEHARAGGLRPALTELGRFLLRLVPAALLAVAVMALLWPWVVMHPLNLFRALGYFSQFFEKPWKELFDGALIAVPDMPRRYVPTLFALQMPAILLLLAGAGVAGTTIAAFSSAQAARPANRRAVLLSVVLAATLPIVVAVATRPAMYNGIRHFLFVLPPLAVAGGFAGSRLLAWLARYGSPAIATAIVLLVAGIALPVLDMVRLHPYQHAYFNRLAGGVAGAHGRYMLDYWGLSFKQAGEALRRALTARGEAPAAGQPWKIAVCGPHPPAATALGKDFEPTWDPRGADFALMLGEFYCAKLEAPVLVEVAREGVVFARAYDLRGRTVTDLFTIPPVERD